jgi:hypothetical protein
MLAWNTITEQQFATSSNEKYYSQTFYLGVFKIGRSETVQIMLEYLSFLPQIAVQEDADNAFYQCA